MKFSKTFKLHGRAFKAQPLLMASLISIALAGCSNNSNDNKSNKNNPLDFEVSVTNLTYSQPLSPIALITHEDDFSGWSIGEAASTALETLAEGGDNSSFAALDGVDMSTSGNGVLLPGAMESMEISAEGSATYITISSMLVNTNDAFTGVTGLDLAALEVGESLSFYLPVYDAGTEANSELAGSIPGPADGGEGYNAARDDVDFVARHPGVVGQEDGYAESVLSAAHKFDSPVAMVTISRTN